MKKWPLIEAEAVLLLAFGKSYPLATSTVLVRVPHEMIILIESKILDLPR